MVTVTRGPHVGCGCGAGAAVFALFIHIAGAARTAVMRAPYADTGPA